MTLKNRMGGLRKVLMYECPVCGEIFKKYQSVYQHIKRKHKGTSTRNIIRINAKTGEYVETKIDDNA